METLKIYKVSDKYIRFLRSRDPRVQDNKNRRRPYVGVVLQVSDMQYFVPMESPKPNHANLRPAVHIMRLAHMGLLGFNNMIPVVAGALELFDIDAEPESSYRDLLHDQLRFINDHKDEVMDRASRTYEAATTSKPNSFFRKICCDFKKLEKASLDYNPAHRPTPR